MPGGKRSGLEIYQRGQTWWARGRLEGEDRYHRESLGTHDEQVAKAKARAIEDEARKRALLGRDAPRPEERLTLADVTVMFPPSGNDAAYMVKLLPIMGTDRLRDITPKRIKDVARLLYPNASVDTWHRQVVVPVRARINAAHEEGLCPPIRVKAYTKTERVAQDRARGKDSGVRRQPGSWEWVLAFRQHADPRLGAMALFMFTTGARIGQTETMERETDMDLFNLKVRLPAAKGHPAQWIDILPQVAVDIANLPKPNGKLNQERVFYWAGGRSGWFYEEWRRACKAAGVPYLPPHAAGRHGFGTEMVVRQGIDPVTAAREGRWSSPKVLLDTYSHAEEGSASVRQAFQDGMAAARTKSVQAKRRSSRGRPEIKASQGGRKRP